MANEIREKFGTPTALTISGNSLASSTAGVGRQSTIVTSNVAPRVFVHVAVKQGTSPTGNRSAQIYGIRSDGTRRDDGAGASDAALTVLNAMPIGVLNNKSSPSTGDVIQGWFAFENPGPEWGIAVVHDTGVNLDSSTGITAYYQTDLPEVQ